MGYAVIKGGQEAVKMAEKLVDYFRLNESKDLGSLSTELIEKQLRFAVYKVMSEGSLYDPLLAAMAIKQAEGDLIEASFIIRAFRTATPRWGYSAPIDSSKMRIVRRVSSTFREVPGGQCLGPTRDYTLRILKPELASEDSERVNSLLDFWKDISSEKQPDMPKIVDILRQIRLVAAASEEPEGQIHDITKNAMRFPNPSRSARLQSLSRGESGAMVALAYSSLRGYGHVHPTLAELRVGYVPVTIIHPWTGDEVCIGEILITECHAIIVGVHMLRAIEKNGDLYFELGYGAVFGQEERKAISMAILDASMTTDEPKAPAEDKEFVLYHIDGVESSGFVDHIKLPHYLHFTSALDRMKAFKEVTSDE
ncbi:MAG: carbon-phosphorus lyase complex subunit PhnI [Spirochaetota bacterium]